MTKDKVLFRKFHNGEIVALFPEIPADINGVYCVSYQHVGQHGAASPDLSHCTEKATPEEYNALKRELIMLGYRLQVVTRQTTAMDRLRIKNGGQGCALAYGLNSLPKITQAAS